MNGGKLQLNTMRTTRRHIYGKYFKLKNTQWEVNAIKGAILFLSHQIGVVLAMFNVHSRQDGTIHPLSVSNSDERV